jgi:hypothetical protein
VRVFQLQKATKPWTRKPTSYPSDPQEINESQVRIEAKSFSTTKSHKAMDKETH